MGLGRPILDGTGGSPSPFPVLLAALLLLGGRGGTASASTVHDVLRRHGLPAGLLPRDVRSFSLDRETGLLRVRLAAPCYGRWPDTQVFFDRVVSGNLSYGELGGVVGLSQEELFLWLPVKAAISVPSSGVLVLDLGFALKQVALSLFENPPECRPLGSSGDPLLLYAQGNVGELEDKSMD